MYKSFKVELKPNNKQRTLFLKNCGAARWAYNWAITQKKAALEAKEKMPSAMDLSKQFTILKKTTIPWTYECSKNSMQNAIRHADGAFKKFFRGRKAGRKSGFPKFRSRRKGVGSFETEGWVRVLPSSIQIPKVGIVRLKERNYIPVEGKIVSATISEKAGHWFASVLFDLPDPILGPKGKSEVGVDLGIKALATISDGTVIDGPKALESNLRQLKRLSKRVSRKVKGSRNRKKAVRKLSRKHYKISCIRRDSLHKVTTMLAKTKSRVVIEDLKVQSMARKQNRGFARRISDVGFYEFRRQLEYKGKWYGCEVVIADQFFPSSKKCSQCGSIKYDLTLADRVYRCEDCGLVMDRDLNGAINLANYIPSGRGEFTPVEMGASPRSESSEGCPSMKQEASADRRISLADQAGSEQPPGHQSHNKLGLLAA